MDTEIHIYLEIQGYRDTGIYRYLEIHGYRDTGIYRYRDKEIQGDMDSGIQI